MSRRIQAVILGPGPRTRAAVLVMGLLLIQFILYGSSILGTRVFIPLDILNTPGIYSPATPDHPFREPADEQFLDAAILSEPNRIFAVRELRAGRLPLWNPDIFCGAPFIASNITAVFSPFRLIEFASENPVVLAWAHLVRTLVGGIGAYLFFRRITRALFWPAVIGAWCFPVTGAVVLWTLYSLASVIAWLPWLLLFVGLTVRKPAGLAPIGVAVTTGFILVSGHSAAAAHALLCSGVFGIWCLYEALRGQSLPSPYSLDRFRGVALSATVLALAWSLGILATMLQTLPTLDYLKDSHRIKARAAGQVETPPVGVAALPMFVLPFSQGTTHLPGAMLVTGNRQESPAPGYAGLFLVLVAAPLGFLSRRHRRSQLFWFAFATLTAGQVLGIPIVAWIYDHGPFIMLRNNRFVMISCFALLTMSVAGLDAVCRGRIRNRGWDWAFLMLPVALGAWCLIQFARPPDQIHQAIEARVHAGSAITPLTDPGYADLSMAWFSRVYLGGFALCVLAAMLWLAVRFHTSRPRSDSGRRQRALAMVLVIGTLSLAEMTFNAWGVNPQGEWRDAFPRIPALEMTATDIAQSKVGPSRIAGMACLAPNIAQIYGLEDVRGYDAADPDRMMKFTELFRDPSSSTFTFAQTLGWIPAPSPLAHLAGIRYLVFRGSPPPPPPSAAGPPPTWRLSSPDYWIRENINALPRVIVPQRVAIANDEGERLKLLADPRFDGRRIMLIESMVPSGLEGAAINGEARISSYAAQDIMVNYDMKTPGMILLTDRYDTGWKACVNGIASPIYPADEAFRAVRVPAGKGSVEFRYEPQSFRIGLWISGIAVVVLLGWTLGVFLRNGQGSGPGKGSNA